MYLYDELDSTPEEVIMFIKEFYRHDLKIILLHNKIDLQNGYFENEFDAQLKAELFPEYTSQIIAISAKNKTGIEALKFELSYYIQNLETQENTIITNQRHYEALQKSLESVKKVEQAITGNISTELLAYELRYALEYLGRNLR